MKPHFVTKLQVTPLANGVNWQLVRNLEFIDARGARHVVHAGFVTDFASIPDLDRLGLYIELVGAFLCLNHGLKFNWHAAIGGPLVIVGLAIILICPLLNRDDQLDAPATIHDDGYRRRRYGRYSWLLKFYWDWILFEAMRANREPLWKCWLIWTNVTLFGWFAWYQDGRKAK